MDRSSEPEIRRTSLTNALLQLKCAGQDIEDIEFMDQPDPVLSTYRVYVYGKDALTLFVVSAALRTLFLIQALDDKKALTPMGRKMATYPIEPEHAAILLESVGHHCTSEIISIIASDHAIPHTQIKMKHTSSSMIRNTFSIFPSSSSSNIYSPQVSSEHQQE